MSEMPPTWSERSTVLTPTSQGLSKHSILFRHTFLFRTSLDNAFFLILSFYLQPRSSYFRLTFTRFLKSRTHPSKSRRRASTARARSATATASSRTSSRSTLACSNSSSKSIRPWAIRTRLVTTGMTSAALCFRIGPVGPHQVTLWRHGENSPFSSPPSISSADSSTSIIAGRAAV